MGRQIRLRWSVLGVASAVMMTSAAPAVAQSELRTAWGAPNLNGIWDFRTITPMERPEELGDKAFLTEEEAAQTQRETVERNEQLANRPAERTGVADRRPGVWGSVDRREDGSPGFYNNFWLDYGTQGVGTRRTSLVVDPPSGRIPSLTANAERDAAARRAHQEAHPADSWVDRPPKDRCLLGFNAGPPIIPGGYNQNLQLFQTPDHVALVTEMVHTHRIVPLDARDHLPADIEQWSGDSRARWEDDTLVVETRNFNPERGWRESSGNMTLVERFTRIDAETLLYEYTVSDPETWSTPWAVSIPMRRTDVPMYEYACHEGNYSMPGILAGARADELAAHQR